MNIFLFISTFVSIYLITYFCELFTNAIEHFGNYFKIQDGALGSIFAAVGTAFPETVLPLIAIFGAYLSHSNVNLGQEIGKGAILGSPFMLSSLALFLVASWIFILSLRNKRDSYIHIDVKLFHRDLLFFIIAYSLAFITSFIQSDFYFIKIIIAMFLLAFYIFYAVKTVKKYCCDDDFCENKCEELILFKFFKNICKSKITLIFIQLFFSAFALMLIANVFVENIKSISNLFHINALLISLFLAPMATELPETINGLVWSSKNKDTLAISNITGAMVFQACIPMSIGIVFTDWSFSFKETINIFCVYMAIAILFVFTRNKIDKFSFKYLIFSIIPYVIYLLFVFANYF